MMEDEELVGYYTVLFKNNVRIIVLDSYDISLLQRDSKTSKKYQEAYQILTNNNSKNMKDGNENSPDGLLDTQRRYVAFNGGCGYKQLQWFNNILLLSRHNNEKVIIISHQPIHPKSTHPNCLIWNYNDVLNIMNHYNDIILVSFSGHAHKGGYYIENNIHYKVVEAVLENIIPTYLIIDIYNNNEIHIRGYGNCPSQIWYHNNNIPTATIETTTTQQPQQKQQQQQQQQQQKNLEYSSSSFIYLFIFCHIMLFIKIKYENDEVS
jgi:manganese-dependent ADP-ribose/CDP-alcohol diphosphatase